MKTIEYRGGVVSFKIPANWVEEYEPNGGGTFFENSPDSGTLRLNILTFEAPPDKLPDCGYDKLIADPNKKGAELIRLPSGDGLKRYMENVEEDGDKLNIYYWEVSHCAPPRKYYIAIFSWTISEVQSKMGKFRNDIKMINGEITKIKFHPDLGNL